MSRATDSEIIASTRLGRISSYLEADYWNGKMFDETLPRKVSKDTRIKLGTRIMADARLQSYLDARDGVVYLGESLNEGNQFNPNEHQPGTIILMNRESLTRTGRNIQLPNTDYDFPVEPDPLAPINLGSFSPREATSIREIAEAKSSDINTLYANSTAGPILYNRAQYFGVVVPAASPTKITKNSLAVVSTSDVWRLQTPRDPLPHIMIAKTPFADQSPTITVGQTAQYAIHTPTTLTRFSQPSEILSRVNALGIIVEGQGGGRRKRINLPAPLLSKLLPDGIMNFTEEPEG